MGVITIGKMDAESKKYLSNREVFADAFNYKLFDGRQVVLAQELEELDSSEVEIITGSGVRIPIQKYRDILKLWTVLKDKKAVYVIFGVEAQTNLHYAMPVRDMLYDALNYAAQVEEIRKTYRKKGGGNASKLTGDEFLSGFRKEDKIKPVITLVIYLGTQTWDGPMSIYDMFETRDEELLRFIPDYRINLLTPEGIPDKDFEKFHTDFGKVLEYIKYSEDKEKIKQFSKEKRFERVDPDSADLINVLTKSKLKIEKNGGVANVCKGIEDLRIEERSIGREEGREEGSDLTLLQNIKNVMESFGVSAQQAVEALKVPKDSQSKYLSRL